MPGSDLSLRHLPDLSDVSFSFQIPADSGDDLLHGDSADFFGGATSMTVSPVAPRSVVDAPPTLVDPQGLKELRNLFYQRFDIQASGATQMASKMLKAIPASEMNPGPFHGAATPRVGTSIDSESNDAQESTPRSKACNDTSKAKSHPMNLSPDGLFSHLPNDSPIDGVSSKDAERVSADPSAEEKNSSLPEMAKTARLPPPKSKKTATIPNQKSSTTTTSNPVKPKPTSTFATTKPRAHPVPAKTARTNVEPHPRKQDVEPDSGIAGRLSMYGAQMITSFPQSDNDEERTLWHDSPGSSAEGDVAMTDNILPAGPEVVEVISPSDIFSHRSEPSPAHHRMEVTDSKPRVSVVLDSEAGIVDSSVPQTDPLMSNSRDDPLTLSQLSPRKIEQHVQESGYMGGDSGKRAVSPMRPAVKRLSSAASAEDNEHGPAVRERGGVRTVSAPAHVRTQPARKFSDALRKPVRIIQRTASSASSTSTLPRNAVVSAAPKIKKLPGISSAGSSSAAHSRDAQSADRWGVQERELFDEKVREKERELEVARELQRREREEEQAKEIREMRRRAVPKVPDWYKEAPKKKPEPELKFVLERLYRELGVYSALETSQNHDKVLRKVVEKMCYHSVTTVTRQSKGSIVSSQNDSVYAPEGGRNEKNFNTSRPWVPMVSGIQTTADAQLTWSTVSSHSPTSFSTNSYSDVVPLCLFVIGALKDAGRVA
ncbi:hypothetical protein R3P38DRAFT_2777182 [Favolaschia claudopus]|uniref:TPX2 C-terminal domain-containing protein n=1 Tax=Favolaschia claudopus TaxID=2862362 RepID=A0AAW0BLF3_9AGAR